MVIHTVLSAKFIHQTVFGANCTWQLLADTNICDAIPLYRVFSLTAHSSCADLVLLLILVLIGSKLMKNFDFRLLTVWLLLCGGGLYSQTPDTAAQWDDCWGWLVSYQKAPQICPVSQAGTAAQSWSLEPLVSLASQIPSERCKVAKPPGWHFSVRIIKYFCKI